VLCKRWAFSTDQQLRGLFRLVVVVVVGLLGISAFFLLSLSVYSWNFRLLVVVVVIGLLGVSALCLRRDYLPRALPMSCFGEKCLQVKEIFIFQKSLQGYVLLLLLLPSFEKKRFFAF
jgi:hypothetical protein